MTNNVGVVILAAGDGKRMQTGTPKVMNVLRHKPLIEYVVRAVEQSGVGGKPVVVVSAKHVLVQDYLGKRGTYVVQEDQLGTGQAVACAESLLKNKVAHVMVLYGDMPLLKPDSIHRLAETHIATSNTLTLFTTTVNNFEGSWQAALSDFGRIVRNASGQIVKSVELRDATPSEATSKELNVGGYCFAADWLWGELKRIKNNNVQKEYYLTDLIAVAIAAGERVVSVSIEPQEAVGINSKEQLSLAEKL